jgi:hypothetical protein
VDNISRNPLFNPSDLCSGQQVSLQHSLAAVLIVFRVLRTTLLIFGFLLLITISITSFLTIVYHIIFRLWNEPLGASDKDSLAPCHKDDKMLELRLSRRKSNA